MISHYNYGLVALSVAIAILASYAAVDLAGRTRAAQGARRWLWLTGGATAMGLGIWAMHYIGMLAFHLPVPILYDVPTVMVSLLAAIAASAVALFVVSRNKLSALSVGAGSIVMGSGIAAMHYVGMAAMRLAAMYRYDSRLVALSVAVAIVISFVALVLTYLSRDEVRGKSWRKIGSAVLMGIAVPVMHYTGMAAASFMPAPLIDDTSRAVGISAVGVVGISSVTLLVLGFAILTSVIDRRFSSQTLELESSENRYRMLFERSLAGVYRSTLDGRMLDVNAACFRIFGYATREEHLAHNASEVWLEPAAREEFIARLVRLKGIANSEVCYRRKDGTLVWVLESVTLLEGENGAPADIEGTVIDITKRKEADQERDKLVALLENSPDFIGMATLAGKPFYVNRSGRELVGLGPHFDVSSTNISDFSNRETATLFQDTAIPAVFAVGHWLGEGSLRHFTTQALIPVHIHAFLVRSPETQEPICLATVQRNITDIKEAEQKLERANRELLEVSRLSGMAEIATSVLHNVGNVLNSVNVSADRISEKVKRLKPASLEKVAALLRDHVHDLPDFLSRDPRGKELPGYLSALVEQLADPQRDILPEVVSLRKNIEHIREIVRTQQDYASVSGVLETMALTDLVEDAIRITAASLTRHEVQLIREYSPVPSFPIDKHKVLQILVNLLSNAKYALDAAAGRDSKLTVRIEMNGVGSVKVSVMDNGVGIAPENLIRIFQHGFTTREGGHGFGLHSGALAAQELGGSLTAESGGSGEGAVFTLELPCHADVRAA
jgi:PAS domain S-box-containing protein